MSAETKKPKPLYGFLWPIGSSSASEEWEIECSQKLAEVFQTIKVIVVRENILPFAYIAHTHGRLNKNYLKKIWETKEAEDRKNLYDRAKALLLDLIQPVFQQGIISQSKKKIILGDCLYLIISTVKIKDISEVSKSFQKGEISEQDLNQFRDMKLLQHLNINTGGLISLSNLARNHLTLIGQAEAVSDNFGFCYDGLVLAEFTDQIPELRSTPVQTAMLTWSNLLHLLLMLFWFRYRLWHTSEYKSDIRQLSETISDLKYTVKDLKRLEDTYASTSEKISRFLAERTRIVDESGFANRRLRWETKRRERPFEGEIEIPVRIFEPPLKKGVVRALCDDLRSIIDSANTEYDTLETQFGQIHGYIRGLIDLLLASSNTRLAATNIKFQWALLLLTVVVTIFTGVQIYDVLRKLFTP